MHLHPKHQKNRIFASNSTYPTHKKLTEILIFFFLNSFYSLEAAISCLSYLSRSAVPEY